MQIAGVPETMRGFGHIKEKNVKAAKEREASLARLLSHAGQRRRWRQSSEELRDADAS